MKVLFINGSTQGCDFYRILQPARALLDRGLMVGISKYMSQPDLETFIDQADVFFFQKTSESFLKFMYENRGKRKFIMDQDDDNFSVSPYNPGYTYFGYKEVEYTMGDGSKVKLKDKQNDFDIERNKRNLQLLKTSLTLADKITTPSPVLSGKLKRLNKTSVIPNFIDFKNWEPINLVKDGWIRIGYQCGWSHFEDFWEVREALREVLWKHPKTRLVVMGQHYEGAMKDFPQDRIDLVPWVDIETYPWRMKALNLDVGIAPLCNSEFNNSKSVIKWEEYSALKIPCVASNVVPYSLKIHDGMTGYLCDQKEEWVRVLSNLVENKNIREEIGDSAYHWVKDEYDLEKQIYQYENLIKEVAGTKIEILM